MSDAFQAYAEELDSLLLNASSNDSSVFTECNHLLKQMQMEARCLSSELLRQECLDTCKVYKSRTQVAKLEMERTKVLKQGAPQEQHDALTHQNATLQQAVERIQETETIAQGVAQNLAENRETIERAQGNAKHLTGLASQANKIADTLLKPWWKKGFS